MPIISYADATHLARGHARVLIAGGPGTGKTTLADAIAQPLTVHTDDLLDVPWSEQRGAVTAWAAANRDAAAWLIEGVTIARCLRHGELLDQGPTLVLYLTTVRRTLSPAARRLGESVDRWMDMAAENGATIHRVEPHRAPVSR